MRTAVVDNISVVGRVAVNYGATGSVVIFAPADPGDPPMAGEAVLIVRPDGWMRRATIGEVRLMEGAPGFFLPNVAVADVPRGTALYWGNDLPAHLPVSPSVVGAASAG